MEALKLRARRYDDLINEEREHRARLDLLEGERDFVRTETNTRVAEPRELWPIVIIFAYITLVGVVVPVIGLLWPPFGSDLLIRIVLVSLFVAGLLVLGWYLIRAIRRLSKPSVPPNQDEQTQADSGEPPGV